MDGTSARQRRPNGRRRCGWALDRRLFGDRLGFPLGQDGRLRFCYGCGRWFSGASGAGLRRGHGFLRLRGLRLGHLKTVQTAQLDRHVFIDGAGVRLLLSDAQFEEPIQYFVSLDFQFPRQLVDANLLHRQSNLLLPAEALLIAAA
jgi:hypothetical protein